MLLNARQSAQQAGGLLVGSAKIGLAKCAGDNPRLVEQLLDRIELPDRARCVLTDSAQVFWMLQNNQARRGAELIFQSQGGEVYQCIRDLGLMKG
jgi:hypothetical protein